MKRLAAISTVFFLSVQLYCTNPPKNVIVMIGDGMGLAQVYATMVASGHKLNIERCKYVGFSKTYSYDHFVTDSGAGGTAIACGVKTRNGMIGMKPDSTVAVSLLEEAEKKGLSTGIVVACALTHATPATFVSHQVSRDMYEEIAADYLKTDIDVMIGGGRKYFENREDGKNLTNDLKSRNYQIAYSLDEVKTVKSGKLAGLLYDDQNPPMPERGKMLPESTVAAIDILDNNKKGFLLMIEGSQIDWACHDNDANQLVREMLDFDETVGRVLDYAAKKGNTLVIITADHETGGLSLPNGDVKSKTVDAGFATKSHTGIAVPVYAFGPGADRFGGFMENTEFKSKIESLLRLRKQ